MPAINREELDRRVEQIYDQVVAWRRYIHENPDLSFEEQPTAAYIMGELQKMDAKGEWLHISQPESNCVVADLKGGGGDGPIIALRADIDALPVEELTDVPFASKKQGVMHACGHDTHAAMLLGATRLLLEDAGRIKGTVRLLFQPAEEVPPGGAQMMIEKGCMEGVAMVFAEHIFPFPGLTTGKVGFMRGAVTSSSDCFCIDVIGRGGHASMPESSIDPIAIACLAVTALQQVVSRRMPPSKCPVLTVATITSSSDSYNVIPDRVTLKGTLRTQDREVRENTLKYVEDVVAGVTKSFGATYTCKWIDGYDLTINHPSAVDVSERVFAQVLPSKDDAVEFKECHYGSEDFSAFSNCCPGNFVGIGCYNEAEQCTALNHNAKFKVDEEAMKVGVKVHYGTIHELLMQ
ncbi:amidohydrolase [Leishmania donovani]|uniref:Amidohydrolase_-_putative n=3 Tax=Leishmania donovani species complex TaxID=38574 RepID=A0A6L0XKH8_LEIIN|nr:putative N-acyl-L-amino acid amidohydrolase [Leishmania infantum JPCM5]TPP41504.1 amidohydrolase family protein [Leishmania donovani]CAC9518701.1 amidohydrolase_-_putative [Leishmania infantum]CAJ1991303.1 amidohydrolase [Leishmania donovani]CAM70465.1 putative N-acyl-L-amino acid amidohydrolase [Leishmania infantum JPCM5]SUZ44327.1 amidohydrolase_-_putative [Leishmania infantum]|eukprot:XP_001467407.1 putative N-acyl-L-amino acid amidohydrolase [Leishmania infantum JPCM5]